MLACSLGVDLLCGVVHGKLEGGGGCRPVQRGTVRVNIGDGEECRRRTFGVEGQRVRIRRGRGSVAEGADPHHVVGVRLQFCQCVILRGDGIWHGRPRGGLRQLVRHLIMVGDEGCGVLPTDQGRAARQIRDLQVARVHACVAEHVGKAGLGDEILHGGRIGVRDTAAVVGVGASSRRVDSDEGA